MSDEDNAEYMTFKQKRDLIQKGSSSKPSSPTVSPPASSYVQFVNTNSSATNADCKMTSKVTNSESEPKLSKTEIPPFRTPQPQRQQKPIPIPSTPPPARSQNYQPTTPTETSSKQCSAQQHGSTSTSDSSEPISSVPPPLPPKAPGLMSYSVPPPRPPPAGSIVRMLSPERNLKPPPYKPTSSSLPFKDFSEKYKLPQMVRVTSGIYDPVEERRTMPNDQELICYFQKKTKVVRALTLDGYKGYTIPVNSSIKFVPLHKGDKQNTKASWEREMDSINPFWTMPTLPKALRVMKDIVDKEGAAVKENTLLFKLELKEKKKKRILVTYDSVGRKRCFMDNARVFFSSKRVDLCMFVYEFAEYLKFPITVQAMIPPEVEYLLQQEGMAPEMHVRNLSVLVFESCKSETTMVVNSDIANLKNPEERVNLIMEVPTDLDIEVECIEFVNDEDTADMYKAVAESYEAFDLTGETSDNPYAANGQNVLNTQVDTNYAGASELDDIDHVYDYIDMKKLKKAMSGQPPAKAKDMPLPNIPNDNLLPGQRIAIPEPAPPRPVRKSPSMLSNAINASPAKGKLPNSQSFDGGQVRPKVGSPTILKKQNQPLPKAPIHDASKSVSDGSPSTTRRSAAGATGTNLYFTSPKTHGMHSGKPPPVKQLPGIGSDDSDADEYVEPTKAFGQPGNTLTPENVKAGMLPNPSSTRPVEEEPYEPLIVPPSPEGPGPARVTTQDPQCAENLAYLRTLDHVKIITLLETLGLSMYCGAFAREYIDGDILIDLGEEELKDLGITTKLHLKRMTKLIEGKTPAKQYLEEGSPYGELPMHR